MRERKRHHVFSTSNLSEWQLVSKCKICVFHLIILRGELGKLCKLNELDSVDILKYLPQFCSQGRFKFLILIPLKFCICFYLCWEWYPLPNPQFFMVTNPSYPPRTNDCTPTLVRLVSQRFFSHRDWIYQKLPFFIECI